MKGTPAEGMISRLFAGKLKSYIRCTHVQYESSREEPFYGSHFICFNVMLQIFLLMC